jgi:tRNA pseudouridine38-40 synthase
MASETKPQRLAFLWCFAIVVSRLFGAFPVVSSFLHSTFHVNENRLWRATSFKRQLQLDVAEGDTQHNSREVLTSAVLRISFDGSRFTGWSATDGQLVNSRTVKSTQRSRRRRRRGLQPPVDEGPGFVRSVEGVLRENLAKLWGNVDPSRIVVEGCSRTDKGVHATGMIAHIYCLKEDHDVEEQLPEESTAPLIPGKQLPHPASPTDTSCFESLPMNGNLSKIAFSLNRMRPSDVQITGIAPTPTSSSSPDTVFHSSLSSVSKTYMYRLSTGSIYDPIRKRTVWHVTERSSPSSLNLDKMQQACQLLQGTHDFVAFRGAARGNCDKRRYASQNTKCTLLSVQLRREDEAMMGSGDCSEGIDPPLQHFIVEVTGDRFLYKMVRMLVGAVVAIGLGKLELSDLSRALKTGSWEIPSDEGGRRNQFMCAPAHGLVLKHVDYRDGIHFDWQPLRDLPADDDKSNTPYKQHSNVSSQPKIQRQGLSIRRSISVSVSTFIMALFVTLGGGQWQAACATTTTHDFVPSSSVFVATESNSPRSNQLDALKSSLQPATSERPQIPLPLPAGDGTTSSNYNPQILNALLQLSSPRNIRPYGTDLLVIQVWSDDPAPRKAANNAVLLGGAKLPIAAIGNGFPFRISLGPQNALEAAGWKQRTASSPQDLWLQATVCRPVDNDEDYGEDGKFTPSTSPQTVACPPIKYRPVLQAIGIAKWIVLPSSSDVTGTVGIRAPATLVLQ